MQNIYNKNSLIYHIASRYGNFYPYQNKSTICKFGKEFLSGLLVILLSIFIISMLLLTILMPLLYLIVQIQYDWMLTFGSGPEVLVVFPLIVIIGIILYKLEGILYRYGYNSAKRDTTNFITVRHMWKSFKERYCYQIEFRD